MMSNQDPWNDSGIDPLHKLELARNEITRLLAALAEAERDAARYRWIRDCLWSPIKDEMELQIGPLYFLRSDYQPKDIDWTIDAAMAREEG